VVRIGSPAGPRRGINLPGYTRVYLNWGIVTSSTTADQVIGSYTITTGKILKLQAIVVEVFFMTLSTTPMMLGDFTIRSNVEDIFGAFRASNTSSGALFGMIVPLPEEGLEFDADGFTTIEAVCTPLLTTAIAWYVTILGFERD